MEVILRRAMDKARHFEQMDDDPEDNLDPIHNEECDSSTLPRGTRKEKAGWGVSDRNTNEIWAEMTGANKGILLTLCRAEVTAPTACNLFLKTTPKTKPGMIRKAANTWIAACM